MAAAKAWGVADRMFANRNLHPLYVDDARKVKTTNWEPYLKKRRSLLRAYMTHDWSHETVFFYSYLCIGWTPGLAREMMDALQRAKVRIYIHADERTFGPDDDMAEFWAAHRKELKNAEMKKYRAKSAKQGAGP